MKLRQNMCLLVSHDVNNDESLKEFSKWILDISDDKLGEVNDGEALIQIPRDLCVRNSKNQFRDNIELIYPNLLDSM